LDFAKDSRYITGEQHVEFKSLYQEMGKTSAGSGQNDLPGNR